MPDDVNIVVLGVSVAVVVIGALLWWRGRRRLRRQLHAAAARLAPGALAEVRGFEPTLAQLERAIDQAVTKGGDDAASGTRMAHALSVIGDGIVLFNGTNSDQRAQAIYKDWLKRHEGTDRITGSKTADTRAALVEHFKERGKVMIATEAGAEGINLQFCSLVINYDLPWNPQRIEQRIGRCHRYRQARDVLVVNFVNLDNEAIRRARKLARKRAQREGL